jgi:hypothetical protein
MYKSHCEEEASVPGTTVRIREETREALRELERQTGERPQELLERAVDQFRRSLILAETNVAYGRFRAAGEDDGELREWEGTLADGLDDD